MHSPDDPYLWLEDVHGDAALAWVRERNTQSQRVLQAVPGFEALRDRLRQLLDATDRIPHVTRRGEWLYNFWQDRQHPRGLWRRTTLAAYRDPRPAWETVLDLDALAAAEGEPWVWGGADSLGPEHRRCLLSLSRGGADAKVVREFDIEARAFVDGGFVLPEAKSSVDWIDADAVYVGTDTGPGSMTDSGYPRTVKRWRRGTPLANAQTVFEGQAADVSVSAWVDHTPGFERHFFVRALDFYRQERFVLDGERLVRLNLPDDARWSLMHGAGVDGETLLLELRSELKTPQRTYPSGALLAADARVFWHSDHRIEDLHFQVLFEPSATRSLAGFTTTREHVIVNLLDDVASRLEEWRRTPHGFVQRAIATPSPGRLSVASLHDPLQRNEPLAEHYTLHYTDFLTPDSLSLARTGSDEREHLKTITPAFDATGMHVEQRFATSADGTRVPYFVVWPRDARQRRGEGTHPTLLYGYGGFRITLAPWYPTAIGSAWCARGGVLVVANIRGGGEYGPTWHQAAVREHKQRSHDDFIAVAEDLIARGVTRAPQLGIQGGSNGGLLVGAAFTQRPDLFGAVVCQVPLLDMKRYHRLLAGASWMAEYGDPDQPGDWAFISRYSPYHRVQAGLRYPSVLFTTSTRDDRVHPGHARKMAARMLAQGHVPLYFENTEGGHGLAADNAQRAHVQALEFSHLWRALSR